MNGYVSIKNKYSDAIMKFSTDDAPEITVSGIYKYLDDLLSINKLLIANGSFIDNTNSKNEYNCAFNVWKNNDNDIIITILTGNVISGVIVSPNDKITKIGG